MCNDIDNLLKGYDHIGEEWDKFWLGYVQRCELGTYAPLTLLGSEYELLQSDRDVWDERNSLELEDTYQFYMVRRDDGVTREVWAWDGYGYNAETCLLFRNYERGYEYCEGFGPGESEYA